MQAAPEETTSMAAFMRVEEVQATYPDDEDEEKVQGCVRSKSAHEIEDLVGTNQKVKSATK